MGRKNLPQFLKYRFVIMVEHVPVICGRFPVQGKIPFHGNRCRGIGEYGVFNFTGKEVCSLDGCVSK